MAKPTEAFAAIRPPKIPHVKDNRAIPTKTRIHPNSETLNVKFNVFVGQGTSVLIMVQKSLDPLASTASWAGWIVSTKIDITNGKAHSKMASPTMNKGVTNAYLRY